MIKRRLLLSVTLTALIILPCLVSASTDDREVSLIAVGDIMLSRNVAKRIKDRKDIHYPFLKITDEFKHHDIVFANLECPITKGPVITTGQMTFHADPGAEQSLKDAGVSIVSLANNHTPNFGVKGLSDTFASLKRVGIGFIGAGNDFTEASKPVFITKNGITIAFLGYNSPDVVPPTYQAAPNHPGTAFMNIELMKVAVKRARQHADLVVVSMHAGTEYRPKPNKFQITFAHAAIDAGAEMVIGHHPHVVQSMEEYKGHYIFYSLGNFVFDQMFSSDTREGLGIAVTLTKTGVKNIKFLPLLIENYAQPHWLEGKEALAVIKKLGDATITNMMLIPKPQSNK